MLEYERWHRGGSLSSLTFRWWMSRAGLFVVNAPVYQLKENLKIEASARVLDIGCGSGSALALLDERVAFECPPVGIDFGRRVLHEAREAAAGSERHLEFVQGSAVTLPFRDGAFDLVISSYLLKHLDDSAIQVFMREVRRVLTPGGLALLWEFAPTGNERLDGWNRWVVSRGVREPRFRSTRALMALGQLAGFEFVRAGRLRPFLLPPIPRASVLLGKAPEGWSPPR